MQLRCIYRLLVVAVALCGVVPAWAGDVRGGVEITNPSMSRSGRKVTVSMGLAFRGLEVRRTGAAVLVPMIVNGADTLRLPSVGIYGRTNWYMSRRNDRLPLGGGEVYRTMVYDEALEPVDYSCRVDYDDWMDGSELIVERRDYGCAGCSEGAEVSRLETGYRSVRYVPTFVYEEAVAEKVKSRELSGRAYIDFPVNRVEIFPDYRGNSAELAKIIATIDSVRNDADVTVTAIAIKGFASPEGKYENNVRLAKGRTETLKQYVQKLYRFAPGFISTDYEPEDWAGLREFVKNSTLRTRDELLLIIDDPLLEPDTKDWRIKLRYPEEYQYLLEEVYPGLRHSDYRIEYMIRSFSDPAEIREVLRTQPNKLSLNEIYIAAQGLEPGSDEYNEIFETAARLFPSEPVANLNAANAAMQRGDLAGAARYLERAGSGASVTYARGVLSALNGDYAEAIRLVEQAAGEGWVDGGGVLEHLREVAKYN